MITIAAPRAAERIRRRLARRAALGLGQFSRRGSLYLPREGLIHPRRPHLSPITGILAGAQLNASAPGGGGYTGVEPDDVADLLVWWRSDVGLSFETGTEINTVADQSGNGNDGSWDGSRWTQEPNVTGNLPAIRAPGAGQLLMPTSCFSGVTAAQIFLALACDEDVPAASVNTGLWNMSPTDFCSHYSFTDSIIYDGWGSATRFTIGNPTLDLSTWHRLSVKAESSGYAMYHNGASIFSNATSSGSSWRTGGGSGTPSFGSCGGSFFFNGDFIDLFIFSRVLDSGEAADMDQYMSDRIDGTWDAEENP